MALRSYSTPLLNCLYWELLQDLLKSEISQRDLKQCLQRIPVIPTLASFLSRFASISPSSLSLGVVNDPSRTDLLNAVNACYSIFLPLISNSNTADALLDCLKSFLQSSTLIKHSKEWLHMANLLVAALQSLPLYDKNMQKKVCVLSNRVFAVIHSKPVFTAIAILLGSRSYAICHCIRQ